jgi:hypothetical protein
MKKNIVLALAILLFSQLHSQITKNNWLVGGSGAFTNDKTKLATSEISSTQIDLNPRIGYFLIDHFASGLFGNYTWVSSKNNNSRSSYTYFGIGPFLRYYFLPDEKRINLLMEGTVAYNGSRNNLTSTNSGFISYSFSGGPVIFLNSSVGLEFLLGYRGYQENDTETKSNGIKFSIGIQFHLEKE